MSAHVSEVNEQDFASTVLQASAPVLVDFWAPWCGPCRAIAPVVEELASRYAGQLRVVKVNVDDNQDLQARYGIMSIPTLLFFKNGQVVQRVVGAMPRQIADAVEQVLTPAGAR